MRFASTIATCLLICAHPAAAQYVPPSPPGPAPGAIDTWLSGPGPAPKTWDVGVNERLRAEDRLGAGTTHAGSNYDFSAAPASANNNAYWISRLLPRIIYTGDWLSVGAEARSSYSFGDHRYNAAAPGLGVTDNDGPLQCQLAYVQIGNLQRYPLTLKIGRQELAYGEQRLVGPAMWLNAPRTFDAVKGRYQNGFLGVDLFAGNVVYDRQAHFNQSNSQDTLSGAYFDFPGWDKSRVIEAYFLARNVARGIVTDDWSLVPAPFRFPAPQDLYTLGFRMKTKPGAKSPWDYGIEAMWQFGSRTAVFPATPVAAALVAPRLDQNAWAGVAQGGYTWKTVALKPRLALLVSAASGDKSPADRASETFQNLLSSNHGLYGAMDLSGLQNIVDYRLAFTLKPNAVTSLALDLHQQYLETTRDYWFFADFRGS